jgi:sugar transferase (PEP-CTERM system associated)
LIRLLNAYFPRRIVFLGILEWCLVALAFVAATIARLGMTDASVLLSYEQGFLKISVLSAAFIVCMYYFDLYDSSILRNKREVLIRLVQVLGAVSIMVACLYYVYPPLELGRGVFLIGWAIVAVSLMLWRRLFLVINSLPQFAERVVIFGDAPLGKLLFDELSTRPELGLRIVGQLSEDIAESVGSPHASRSARGDLARLVESERVRRIILAIGERRGKLPLEQLLRLKNRGVVVQDGADLYEAVTGKVPYDSQGVGWLLFSRGMEISRLTLALKRAGSFLLSVLGLLMALPLIPLIAMAIKLSSAGPVFYKQERVGRDGRLFECYKFRTMRADAEAETGPTFAADADPRVTRVGRFLRTSRLDELPQLWNVLKGDMSLVGPRPERPNFVDRFNREIPWYDLRHTVPPGATGWAQVRYGYGYGNSTEDAKEKLGYDLFYIRNMSMGLDLLILFETVKIILLGRGAK